MARRRRGEEIACDREFVTLLQAYCNPLKKVQLFAVAMASTV